jgi:Zn-finger nucleic acid-binding protein
VRRFEVLGSAFELQQTVAVDSCPEYTGVFRDAGELAAIRSRGMAVVSCFPAL